MKYVILKRQNDDEIIQLYYEDELPEIDADCEIIDRGSDENVEAVENQDTDLEEDVI